MIERTIRGLAILGIGAVSGLVCGVAILLISSVALHNFNVGPEALGAAITLALFYGAPIGALAFAISYAFLKRRVDLRRKLPLLLVMTIAGGCIGAILWDAIIAIPFAIGGYVVGCLLAMVPFPAKAS